LETDSKGNFYFVSGRNLVELDVPLHGALFKVPPDGNGLEVFATGFRAANGLAIGLHDEITCGDNQGFWIPSSKISLIRKGGFYGHAGDPRKASAAHPLHPPETFEAPICWIPMAQDSSSAGQVWVTS